MSSDGDAPAPSGAHTQLCLAQCHHGRHYPKERPPNEIELRVEMPWTKEESADTLHRHTSILAAI